MRASFLLSNFQVKNNLVLRHIGRKRKQSSSSISSQRSVTHKKKERSFVHHHRTLLCSHFCFPFLSSPCAYVPNETKQFTTAFSQGFDNFLCTRVNCFPRLIKKLYILYDFLTPSISIKGKQNNPIKVVFIPFERWIQT